MTTITALPAAPVRGDPSTFAATADTFLSALPTFGTECNAVAAEMQQSAGIANSLAAAFMLPGYRGTSTSSIVFGTGSKTLTTQNNLLFVAGMSVTLSLTASATSYMQGTVTSYSGTTLVLNITSSNASGTYNDWQITPTNTNLQVQGQPVTTTSLTATTLVTGSLNSGPLAGFRNRIINGSMLVDQRNSGSSQTISTANTNTALAYCIDRWYATCTGANVSGARVWLSTPYPTYAYQFTGAASNTKIVFSQRLEALSVHDLSGSTATFSVSLANSLLTTVTWTAYYANTTNSFGALSVPTRTQIATGTFTVSSTLTKYSAQIAMPSLAWQGVELELSVGAQTSGTWTITEAQLEAGNTATPFERRPVAAETLLCQRYYYRAWLNAGDDMPFFNGYANSTTQARIVIPFPTPLRIVGAGLYTSGVAADYGVNSAGATSTVCTSVPGSHSVSRYNALLSFTTTGLTAGQAVMADIRGSNGHLSFSAEL